MFDELKTWSKELRYLKTLDKADSNGVLFLQKTHFCEKDDKI